MPSTPPDPIRPPLPTRWQSGRIAPRHQFLLLFLFLLASLIAYPYTEHSLAGYYIFRLLGSGIIVFSVYAVSFRRRLVVFAVLLAIPAFLRHILLPEIVIGFFPTITILLSFAFDVFIVVAILHRIFGQRKTTSETIFGALCVYLLMGFSFASIYGLVLALQPHAFYLDPLTNRHAVPDRFDFIYYSFGNLTALGANGITAVSDEARSLSIIEAIVGLMYLAVLISRLVGTYASKTDSGMTAD